MRFAHEVGDVIESGRAQKLLSLLSLMRLATVLSSSSSLFPPSDCRKSQLLRQLSFLPPSGPGRRSLTQSASLSANKQKGRQLLVSPSVCFFLSYTFVARRISITEDGQM